MAERREYPGLEAILRRAMDRAKDGLPPDVGVGVMFTFHYGEENTGGFAWAAGCPREDAIGLVVEWLRKQAADGHQDAVLAAVKKWFGS